MSRGALTWALLRLYPDRWRAEYGKELAMVLSHRPITASVVVDVALSAVREQWYSGSVWMACGTWLFAWTALVICLNNTAAFAHLSAQWSTRPSLMIPFLAGCLTAWRKRDVSPAGWAVNAALLGSIPELVMMTLWTAGLFHPLVITAAGPVPLLEIRLATFDTTFPTTPQPGFVAVPFAVFLTVVQARVMGFFGGLLGRLFRTT